MGAALNKFFPPDVSVRLAGDKTIARTHISEARGVLTQALLIDKKPASLSRELEDGTLVHVLISGNQKIVTITGVPPEIPPVEEPPRHAFTPPGGPQIPFMLSGWTRAVDSGQLYYPSPANQRAYGFEAAWQYVEKLIPSQIAAHKPSSWSGSMKRVVQAMLGIGRYVDDSPSYLSGAVTTEEREMIVNYDYRWYTTDGVIRTGVHNHWVVRVSPHGVLAMPLITIPITRTNGFREIVEGLGDTDTVKVLDEFGGLPSGDAIPPEGPALEAAIEGGKVLRLLTAEEMEVFYSDDRAGFYHEQGWAFPDTGREIQGVCVWRDTNYRGSEGGGVYWPHAYRFERWAIRFNLSPHDIGEEIVGTGSATIDRVETRFCSWLTFTYMMVPWSADELRSAHAVSGDSAYAFAATQTGFHFTQSYGSFTEELTFVDHALVSSSSQHYGIPTQAESVGAAVNVFYADDVLRRELWVPWHFYYSGVFYSELVGAHTVLTFVGSGLPVTQSSPAAYFIPGLFDLRSGTDISARSDPEPHTWVPPVYAYGISWFGPSAAKTSSGPGKYSAFFSLHPAGCRESVVLFEASYTLTFTNTPNGTVANRVQYYQQVAYIPGIGRVYLDRTSAADDLMYNLNYTDPGSWFWTYDMGFAMAVSARQTQYCVSAIRISDVDPWPDSRTNVTRPSLAEIHPPDLNWVGAPD